MKIVEEIFWDEICPHDSSELVKTMCGKIIDGYSVVEVICLSDKHNEIKKCVDILFRCIIIFMLLVQEKCDCNNENIVAVLKWLMTVVEALEESDRVFQPQTIDALTHPQRNYREEEHT